MAAFWIATSKLGLIRYRHLKLDLTRDGDDAQAHEVRHLVTADVWPPWMHQKAALTGVPIQGYGNKIDDFGDGIDIIGLVRVAIRGSFFRMQIKLKFYICNTKQVLRFGPA